MAPAALLAACLCLGATPAPAGAAPDGGEPAGVAPDAAGGSPVVLEARAHLRAHEARAALERLRAAGAPRLQAPDEAWLWAQVAPAFEGRAAVLASIARLPASPLRTALEALLDASAAATRDRLRIALRRQHSPWLRLALVHALARLGEHGEVLGEARSLARARVPFVALEATLLAARAHVHLGQLEAARAAAAGARALAPQDARGPALEAEALRRLGRGAQARGALRTALALAPRSELLARRLADLVREPLAVLPQGEWQATLRGLDARNPEALALRALHAQASGTPAQALEALDLALAAGARPVPLEAQRRRLLAALGRWRELVEALEAAVPADYRQRPDNLLAARWQALRHALGAASAPGAPPPAIVALAQALVGLGALHEAQAVLRHAPSPGAQALDRRIEGQLALEQALRSEVEAGYRAGHTQPAGGAAVPLAGVLERVAQAAAAHLVPEEAARLAQPREGLREVGLVGAWLDHRVHSSAPLVQHFRAYGRYLVVGQRDGEPVEAIVFALATLVPQAPVEVRGVRMAHDLALGYDRVLRSFVDAQGGGLAGACLPDGLWLDADAALEAQHEALAPLRRDTGLVAAAEALPLPAADGPQGRLALHDPAGVRLRLLAAHARGAPGERWASLATLHAHEEGHVLDLRRHLPLWQGLPATLGLLAREGFAFARFEAALERRAQLVALAASPHPYLVLAEMVERLPAEERDIDPHSRGYVDGLARLVAHVAARADLYPQVDRARLVLPQLDRLSPQQLQAAARAVLD